MPPKVIRILWGEESTAVHKDPAEWQTGARLAPVMIDRQLQRCSGPVIVTSAVSYPARPVSIEIRLVAHRSASGLHADLPT